MVLNNQILKNRNCYNFLDVPGMDYHMCKAVLNPLTPISDQDMIFPHHQNNIKPTSNKNEEKYQQEDY